MMGRTLLLSAKCYVQESPDSRKQGVPHFAGSRKRKIGPQRRATLLKELAPSEARSETRQPSSLQLPTDPSPVCFRNSDKQLMSETGRSLKAQTNVTIRQLAEQNLAYGFPGL